MRFLPALSLVLLTTVIAETVTGSTPPAGFLNPGTLLLLLIGYGLAVLVLREIAVRLNLGLTGMIFFGLAYGIMNEGLQAKTFIIEHVPVALYDYSWTVGGINLPWAAAISLWHAFASFLFPILFVHWFFPKHKDVPWLGPWVTGIIGTLLLLFFSAGFLQMYENGRQGTPGQLLSLVVVIAALMLIGIIYKGAKPVQAASSRKPLLLGTSVIIPFWMLAFAARVPALFFAVMVIAVYIYGRILARNCWNTVPALLYFGIGWYIHNVLQALVILLLTDPAFAAVTGIVGVALLGFLYWLLKAGNKE